MQGSFGGYTKKLTIFILNRFIAMKKHRTHFIIAAGLAFFPLFCSTSFASNSNHLSSSYICHQYQHLVDLTQKGDIFYDTQKYEAAYGLYYRATFDHLQQKELCGEGLNNFLSLTHLRLPKLMAIKISPADYKKMRCQFAQTINNLGMVFEIRKPPETIPFLCQSTRARYKIALYCYEQSLSIRNEFSSIKHIKVKIGKSRHNIGGILINLKQYVSALAWLKGSLMTDWYQKDEAIDTYYLIALVYEREGYYNKAKEKYRKILFTISELTKKKEVPLCIRKTEREIKERLKKLEIKINGLRGYSKETTNSKETIPLPPKPKKPTVTSHPIKQPIIEVVQTTLSQPNKKTQTEKEKDSAIIQKNKIKKPQYLFIQTGQLPHFDIKKAFEIPRKPISQKKRALSLPKATNDTPDQLPSSPKKKRKFSSKKTKDSSIINT